MNKLKKSALLLIPALIMSLLVSCKKDPLLTYDSSDNIYFVSVANRVLQPSGYSYLSGVKFEMLTVDTFRLQIPVQVLGSVSDQDRRFKVVQDFNLRMVLPRFTADQDVFIEQSDKYGTLPDSLFYDRASEGTHFEFGDAIVPAGSNVGYVTIMCKKATNAEDKKPSHLALTLMPNEAFGTDFEELIYNTGNGASVDVLHYHVLISDSRSKPSSWEDRVWGAYSVVKYEIILSEEYGYGKPACFWEDGSQKCPYEGRYRLPAADHFAAQSALRLYLQRRHKGLITDENGFTRPVRDEYGNLIEDVPGFWETMDQITE